MILSFLGSQIVLFIDETEVNNHRANLSRIISVHNTSIAKTKWYVEKYTVRKH